MDNCLINKINYRLHSGAITSISTAINNLSTFLTGSRDYTILIWEINNNTDLSVIPKKRLKGHSNFISEVALSFDGQFCISSSWDKTLKLWDIETGIILTSFIGHKKDVLSVNFSTDNRQIVSSSRDNTIKIWNTIGQCKDTLEDKDSNSWISCVKFIPNRSSSLLSCSWDGIVKIWNLIEKKVQIRLTGHKGYLNCLSISPDGSLCASGGKDSIIMLWDLQEGKHLYSLNANNPINCMCFSPNKYWLCAGTSKGIKVWDLESKTIIERLKIVIPNIRNYKNEIICTAMNWTIDGSLFLSGFVDGELKIWSYEK